MYNGDGWRDPVEMGTEEDSRLLGLKRSGGKEGIGACENHIIDERESISERENHLFEKECVCVLEGEK